MNGSSLLLGFAPKGGARDIRLSVSPEKEEEGKKSRLRFRQQSLSAALLSRGI